MADERDYGFDWRNTPVHKHPKDMECDCPMHEYLREKVNVSVAVEEALKDAGKKVDGETQISLKFCPQHYDQWMKEYKGLKWLKRKTIDLLFKWSRIVVVKLSVMMSEECFLCKYGDDEFRKTELPPVPPPRL